MEQLNILVMSEFSTIIEQRSSKEEHAAALVDQLFKAGFSVDYLNYSTSGDIRKALCRVVPDLVWSQSQFCRGPSGARLNVHALLEADSFPYVGSPPEVLDLVREKAALKERWRERGIRSPAFRNFRTRPDGVIEGLEEVLALEDFPYIVKPLAEGNSRGIGPDSVARDKRSLRAAVDRVLREYGAGLTEEYLYRYPDAREFTVAMAGNGEGRLIMPAELVRNGGARGAVTFADKRDDRIAAKPLAEGAFRRELSAFAAGAFEAAGARDYARLDMFSAGGSLYAVEINGQPMLPDPWFDACAAGAGLSCHSYLDLIVRSGTARLRAARLRAG